jgi:hypothetical protein
MSVLHVVTLRPKSVTAYLDRTRDHRTEPAYLTMVSLRFHSIRIVISRKKRQTEVS